MRYHPGLVEHCIGVDPYYMSAQAERAGYYPELILSARRINEGLVDRIYSEILDAIIRLELRKSETKILLLGATFKPDVPDFRNSKVFDLIKKLKTDNFKFDVLDYNFDIDTVGYEQNYYKETTYITCKYDIIIFSVPHQRYINEFNSTYQPLLKKPGVIFDLYNKLNSENVCFTL